MSNTAYLISNDGIITLVHRGGTHTIGKDHLRYDQIVQALNDDDIPALENHLDMVQIVEQAMDGIHVTDGGNVFWNGQPVHGLVTQRIAEFVRQELPFGGLVAFMERLMANPSKRAVDELYGFLERNGITITTDGMVIAYKGITSDWKDKHTRTFDNSIGAKPRVPRNQVDDDARRACSNGLHVGSYQFARNFIGSDGRVVLVKFDPADAVAVPYEDANKMRVCGYEVISECDERLIEPLYEEREVHELPGADEPLETDCGFCEDEGCEECDGSMDEGALYFDERMNRWRDRDNGGRVVSAKYAASLGYTR